jgi:DNA repair exonuclease SbcCD nuclease subunit
MIKIFHTGDAHLDSAFFRLSPSERESAREHQRKIFKKMIEHVRGGGYSLVLISGDLFDTPCVSSETEKCVIEGFASLDCPVVIAPGNHDYYLGTSLYSSDKLPENVYIFNSEDIQCFEFEELGFRVCGYAFMRNSYSKNPLADFELPHFAGTTLLCAHAELGAPISKYAPMRESDIESAKITYAALGHVHKTSEPIRRGGTLISYCSFPEGRAFDEDGEGGALCVTVSEGEASVERVSFAERIYRTERLDVSGAQDGDEILMRIKEHLDIKGYGKESALRLILCGALPEQLIPDVRVAEATFCERLFLLEVADSTYPSFSTSQLENDYTLRGELYRVLKPLLESEDEEERRAAAEALRRALRAIDGGEVGGEI